MKISASYERQLEDVYRCLNSLRDENQEKLTKMSELVRHQMESLEQRVSKPMVPRFNRFRFTILKNRIGNWDSCTQIQSLRMQERGMDLITGDYFFIQKWYNLKTSSAINYDEKLHPIQWASTAVAANSGIPGVHAEDAYQLQNTDIYLPENSKPHERKTKWCTKTPTPSVVIAFPFPVFVDRFTFMTANDCPERDPVQWLLEGSNDNEHWVTLHRQNTDFNPTKERRTLQQWFNLSLEG